MKIVSYIPSKEGAYELARFDLQIDPGYAPVLRRIRLLKSKRGTLYFSLPQYCVDDGDGEKKWTSYVEFSADEKRQLERDVMPLLEPFYKGGSGSGHSPRDDGRFPVDF